MTKGEKISWMANWCARHTMTLNLEGECGFGRECVGVLLGDNYPDYMWDLSDDSFERADENGDVWIPPDAYHKHPCVAVLGRGEDAEAQLYEWLVWFDENSFKSERKPAENLSMDPIHLLMGSNETYRMVKQ